MPRYPTDDVVAFQDRPGVVYEMAGRSVKVVPGRFGYALYLLDAHGRPALPVSTGGARALSECLSAARAFLRKLDKDLHLAPARPHGLCRYTDHCVEQAHNATVPRCKPLE